MTPAEFRAQQQAAQQRDTVRRNDAKANAKTKAAGPVHTTSTRGKSSR